MRLLVIILLFTGCTESRQVFESFKDNCKKQNKYYTCDISKYNKLSCWCSGEIK